VKIWFQNLLFRNHNSCSYAPEPPPEIAPGPEPEPEPEIEPEPEPEPEPVKAERDLGAFELRLEASERKAKLTVGLCTLNQVDP
jgi:hypothetical protein